MSHRTFIYHSFYTNDSLFANLHGFHPFLVSFTSYEIDSLRVALSGMAPILNGSLFRRLVVCAVHLVGLIVVKFNDVFKHNTSSENII